MASPPLDVPPYQLQPLIAGVITPGGPFSITPAGNANRVTCAQALGSEIYVGCANGELLRYALEEDGPTGTRSYTLLSRQDLPLGKAIDQLVLAPSISRALILSGHQIFFYTLPSLDPVPGNVIQPIRNAITFAADERHLARAPPPPGAPPSAPAEPVDVCVVKRSSVMLYALRDRLFFQKDMPLPQGAVLARRAGQHLCIADRESYSMLDLARAALVPLLPIDQSGAPAGAGARVRPAIAVVGPEEFLVASWTGQDAMGVFVNGEGVPVRGVLSWAAQPLALAFDAPYVTALLPDGSVDVHNVEDQQRVQALSAPPPPGAPPVPGFPAEIERAGMVACAHRYMVPSVQAADKMRRTPVGLLRTSREVPPAVAAGERGALPAVAA